MDKDYLEELTVNGYTFATHADADLARNELKKISYIESKMDMSNMTVVLGIYNKALESHTFQTPIGLEFMHSMYNSLVQSGISSENIKVIPLYTTFKRLDVQEPKPRRITPTEKKEQNIRIKYRNSVLINVIFGILVLVLLLISYSGENVNAINYRSAVTNQYAEWEQELKERESAVREKERELNISP